MENDLPSNKTDWNAPPPRKISMLLPEQGMDLNAVMLDFVRQALVRTEGNQSAAARLLGLTRYALRWRMEKAGIKGRGRSHAIKERAVKGYYENR